ncbi:hypothetical protein FA15DRAFT_627662 [Coprinopsis marcescibilis]|uniref:Nephrocystin 3-like N-terminal domain-containing protein n=1 Tax=Coprinopsis marcescibilis TaxID=230819 RepID=A0A5C3KFZ1_COPMA|nr:hypothetical protein FA15DRAFT_627662 [Coprinopsis marcescibilis]
MSFFNEATNTTVFNSTLTAVAGNYVHQTFEAKDGMKILADHIAADALYDSLARFDSPRCEKDTRIVVQDDIMGWVFGTIPRPTTATSRAPNWTWLWLSGPAGAGKSAIQQTIAERCDAAGVLAASFFFSHQSAERDNPRKLVATLAYQIALKVPEVRRYMAEEVEADVVVFRRSVRAQMEALVLRPVERALLDLEEGTPGQNWMKWPKVILIDGLDECGGERERGEVLDVLHDALRSGRLPFCVLVARRPELPMREFFKAGGVGGDLTRNIVLDEGYNPDMDIRIYLLASFRWIREKYQLEEGWPSEGVIESLVDKASGHFIYASTVVKFLDDSSCRPKENLELVLRLRKGGGIGVLKNPYAPLDTIYRAILKQCPDPVESILALKIIIGLKPPSRSGTGAVSTFTAREINTFLQLEPSDVGRLFGRLHSLLFLPSREEQGLRPYWVHHKSLLDFLAEPARCGEDLFVSPGAIFARACVQYLRTWNPAGVKGIDGCHRSCGQFRHGENCNTRNEDARLYFVPKDVRTLYIPLSLSSLLSVTLESGILASKIFSAEMEAFDIGPWVCEQIKNRKVVELNHVYLLVHCTGFGCRKTRCGYICRRWREEIIRLCTEAQWKVPSLCERLGRMVNSPFNLGTTPDPPGDTAFGHGLLLSPEQHGSSWSTSTKWIILGCILILFAKFLGGHL